MAENTANYFIFVEELKEDSDVVYLYQNPTEMPTPEDTELASSEEEPVRKEGFAEVIVPRLSDAEFQTQFRMTRATFEVLCSKIAPLLTRERSLTVEKKLMCTLWILGNQECYRSVAERFGLSKGTLHSTVLKVCHALNSFLDELIKFPETEEELRSIAEGFMKQSGLAGVVGAIDATHIPVAPPKINRAAYLNRKGFTSVILQVVCDSSLRFLDVYAGWPGSVHNARVFRNSLVSQLAEELPDEFHLLGDSTYPSSRYLLVPFRDDEHLHSEQRVFNKVHSAAHAHVEKAIDLLKCKFQRLKMLGMSLETEIPVVIAACCILHNFILQYDSDDALDSS